MPSDIFVGNLNSLAVAPDYEGSLVRGRYSLWLNDIKVDINQYVGSGFVIRDQEQRSCVSCGENSPKVFGGGHCYTCFSTLARCDLCVMSPDRCHYAEGTCREPEWGEAFCMQPHWVYLSNTSGPKVGITRDGRQMKRWLDQGASQAMLLARADTRHIAGVLERICASHVSDRTDWRRIIARDAPPIDLIGLARQLERLVELPIGATWCKDTQVHKFSYPVRRHSPPRLLKLDDEQRVIRDNVTGIKGQYLLLTQGAFNVNAHQGKLVEIEFRAPFDAGELFSSDQLSLFND